MAKRKFYKGPYRRTGTFRPKKMDTLRECMLPLIGKTLNLDFMGTGMKDEPYPGQTRWMISRSHDAELSDDQKGRWMPDEDITFADRIAA